MNTHTAEYAELKWRCRRGMLELDILLNAYLDKNYTLMTPEQGTLFNQILDYPDQVLFDLLLGNMQSNDKSVSGLVAQIQRINQ